MDFPSRSGSILAAAADQVSGINTEPLVTEETARARHFVQRCTFFAGGHDLYMLYRLISGQCHPGVDLIDEWIAESDFGPLGIAFRDSPKADDDDSSSVAAVNGQFVVPAGGQVVVPTRSLMFSG